MRPITKTKLAVLTIAIFSMHITDSARGGGPGTGATLNGGVSAALSTYMSGSSGYSPLAPLRRDAALPGQTGAGGSPSVNNNIAGVNPDISRYADFQKLSAIGHAGTFLSGNVRIDGGDLPWAPIQITVTCNGKASFTTTTDSKGAFVIADKERFDSAQAFGRQKSFVGQFIGCTVSAALPGFESTQLTIAPRDVMQSPAIGSIKLTPEEGSIGSAVSSTTAAAPKDSLKLFQKAREDWLNQKPDRARRELQKALEIYPQFAEAWYHLGRLQAVFNSPDAFNSLSKAAAADPKFVLPYELMAGLSANAGKWQNVVDETNHALELNPRGNLDVWFYNALGNYQLKHLDLARVSAAKSLSMDPLHVQPATEQLLAVILSAQHDQPGALEHLRNCLTYFPPGPNLDLIKRQIAQIEAKLAVKAATASSDSTDTPESDFSAIPKDADADVSVANGSCDLDDVLPRVTHHVEEFVGNVDRFTAQENLVHKLFDHDGSLKGDAESRSNYVATIEKSQAGLFSVTEYRGDTQGAQLQGAIRANVAAALVLVFHPAYMEEFTITCAGPADWLGYNTWRVDFRQRLDRPATMSALELGNTEYTLLLKGSAWIDRKNYQIVHMETDLLRPIPDIKLKMLHQSVDYGPVTFAGGAATLWLPKTAEVTADFRGKRLAERHIYSKFQIFSVNTQEKLKLPPEPSN